MVKIDINEQALLKATGGLMLAASVPIVMKPLGVQDNWLHRGIVGVQSNTASRGFGLATATTGAVALGVAFADGQRLAHKNALVGLGAGYAIGAANTFNDHRKTFKRDAGVATGVVQAGLGALCLYAGLHNKVRVNKNA